MKNALMRLKVLRKLQRLKREGRITAWKASCPHDCGIQLSKLEFVLSGQCALHRWVYRW